MLTNHFRINFAVVESNLKSALLRHCVTCVGYTEIFVN